MLIPSIDLQGGRVVQLVQGDKLAIASDDLDGWIVKFGKFPKVQLIDLDAAMSRGNNDALVKEIAAVDSRAGRVCIHGWKTVLSLTAVQAVQLLEGYCEEFLYTHVDKEGLMQGTDMLAITAVAKATERKLTAAGGITTRKEIDALDAMGIDAVVGMAIYTGSLALE